MGSRPTVAVVVTAYRRREFYLRAVDSALRLDPGPFSVEYLLLRDFEDPEVDRTLAARGVRVVSATSPRVGGTLGKALDRSDAEYFAFLDDDDLWLPTRLLGFAEVQAAVPDLAYYHNGFRLFSDPAPAREEGAEPPTGHPGAREGTWSVHRESDGDRLLAFLASGNQERNFSSTVVHRSAFERIRTELEELPAMTDTCALFAGLLSGGPLAFDDRVFTLVRRHRQNVSKTVGDIRLRAEALQLFGSMTSRVGRSPTAAQYLRLRVAREQIYNRVLGGASSPRELLEATGEVLRFGLRHRSLRDLQFVALAVGGLLAPFSIPAQRRWLVPN